MINLKRISNNEVQLWKKYLVKHHNKVSYYTVGKLVGKNVFVSHGSVFRLDNEMEIYEIIDDEPRGSKPY